MRKVDWIQISTKISRVQLNTLRFLGQKKRKRKKKKVRLVVISDTHNKHHLLNIPDGDILLHCGDFSHMYDWANYLHTPGASLPKTVTDFNTFLGTLPHKHKVIIAGNHELGLPKLPMEKLKATFTNAIFLQDTSVILEGILIYGTAWNNIPTMAYGANPEKRAEKRKLIPKDTDILLTHNPPLSIRDLAHDYQTQYCGRCKMEHKLRAHWGDENLLNVVQAIKPKVHCFGHVHEEAGWETRGDVTFVNAATDMAQKTFYFDFYVSQS